VSRILILSDQAESFHEVCADLRDGGYSCSVASVNENTSHSVAADSPDLVVIGHQSCYSISELSRSIKELIDLPVLAVVEGNAISRVNGHFNFVDDFVVRPFTAPELALRIKRLLKKTDAGENEEMLICGDLKIDLAKCEVLVAERIIPLTFKEYELLKFLVNNQDRVFTRDVLLNKVWGFDYYGGDRTVDVHIRRLRSKLEDATHNFIETVRNIGYRFHCSP
jgi:DNA-binding response OmpR family regulator